MVSTYKLRHRTNVITTSIGVLGILLVVLAVFVTAKGANTISDGAMLSGLGVILFLSYWFLAPRSYEVLNDQLIINYGKPRKKIVHFEDVTKLDVHRHSLGAEIKISRRTGSTIYLHPWSTRQLHEILQKNISVFRGSSAN